MMQKGGFFFGKIIKFNHTDIRRFAYQPAL
ncbi:hypothetical protein EZS27_022410 [termite gut metagenome]|uniref:Uncharacterized protein n=1 Tax=termite gut metagenome TaxID=433724 RepID=A0A5J4R4Z3_9ZZZZ